MIRKRSLRSSGSTTSFSTFGAREGSRRLKESTKMSADGQFLRTKLQNERTFLPLSFTKRIALLGGRKRASLSLLLLLLTACRMALGFSVDGLNIYFGAKHCSQSSLITSWRYDSSLLRRLRQNLSLQNKVSTCLYMEKDGGEESDDMGSPEGNESSSGNKGHRSNSGRRRKKRHPAIKGGIPSKSNSTRAQGKRGHGRGETKPDGKINIPGLLQRVSQLETLVASQAVELRKLREECRDLSEAAVAFNQVVELLRQAGLSMENYEEKSSDQKCSERDKSTNSPKDNDGQKEKPKIEGNESKSPNVQDIPGGMSAGDGFYYEYYDDEEIFGTAPASVIDAADSAGASILAAMLAGKQRMLVDVRDAELTRDPDILVQFIELAILPVAAGLEGLKSERNRVKIVFPTVSQLLQYRRTMALAAPEVVALSTLGFDPVAKQDNLVVIIAPSPDDDEGLAAMNELLQPTSPQKRVNSNITQPVVVLNHHMVPVSGPAASFEVAYHLRLLSVQYMTGDMAPEYMQHLEDEKQKRKTKQDVSELEGNSTSSQPVEESRKSDHTGGMPEPDDANEVSLTSDEEDLLEAAMNHASDLGVNHGITRAMVIRAYPRPWHVFVDTSPDTDADFEVAATFDEEPSQDDVNYAIVECLEGSEKEDELVAQQMQAALESGQLNRVSEMLGLSPDVEIDEDDDQTIDKAKDQECEDDDDFDYFNEDSL